MLRDAGYDPVVKPASIIENLPFDMLPETATMYLALSKAMAVAAKAGSGSIKDWAPDDEEITILAADTVVVYDGEIIGKPADENDAFAILSRLRGTSHHVITGCCVLKIPPIDTNALSDSPVPLHSYKTACFYEDTEVFFKNYTYAELRAYVQTDEPYDKAGGYAIQGTFGKYIDHFSGDYDNVIGLPLTKVKQYL